jgi:hypothetical protein
MEAINLTISIFAILGTLFTYFHHDRRIKKQEQLLNEYQLKRFQSEEIEKQKAEIKGNVIKGEKGSRTLKVFNAGKSTAYDVKIEILSALDGIFNFNFSPYEMLNPQESTEMRFFLAEGHIPTLKVKFIWKDDSQECNEFIQVLNI